MKNISVLNSTLDGIVVINRKGMIKFCNYAACEMFGYSNNELKGLAVEVLLPEAIREAHVAQRSGYMVNPKQRVMNQGKRFTARRKGGSEFSVAISLNPTEIGQKSYICVSIQDLTQVEEEAEKLEQSQKLEALGEMVAGIAHNFNNVIAGLSGQAYLLHKQESLSEKGIGRISSINALCDQAANIIGQLLVYARNQNDEFHQFELAEVTNEVVDIAKVTASEKITIQYDKSDDDLPVYGVKTQVQQTLLNLINNAIYAIGEGHGSITVSTIRCAGFNCSIEQCTLNRKDANAFVCIKVSDTGGGIAEKDIHRIFDPFFSTKPQGQGTGLGLSTSYGIVKKHGGEISVSSKSKCGTMFQVFLPVSSDMKDVKLSHLTVPKNAPKNVTILIVDDEPSICSMLAEVLSGLGYTTLVARDGREGVEVFLQHQDEVELVISDVSMPKLDGEELMEKVRKVKSNIPFLFITGHQDVPLNKGFLDDSTRVMLKPFDFIKLSRSVYELITRD